MPLRELTKSEHAKWLYEKLLSDGFLHTHMTPEEFEGIYTVGLVRDETTEKDEIGQIIEEYTKFEAAASRRAKTSTFSSEEERRNSMGRQKRHQEMLDKYEPNW